MRITISCLVLCCVLGYSHGFSQTTKSNDAGDSSTHLRSIRVIKQAGQSLFSQDSSLRSQIRDLVPKGWQPRIEPSMIRKWVPMIPGPEFSQTLRAKPIRLGSTTLNADGFYWPTDTSLIPSSFHRTEVQQEMSVFSIPFSARVMYSGAFMDPWQDRFVYSYDFSEPAFVQSLSGRLGKFDPKAFFSEDIERAVKEKVQSTVNSQVNAWRSRYEGEWESVMSRVGDVRSLLESDLSSLRSMIIPDSLSVSAAKLQQQFEWLSGKTGNLSEKEAGELKEVGEKLNRYHKTQEIFNEIIARRASWDATGWKDAILKAELLQRTKVQEMLRSPGAVKQLARQKLNLSSLERFFLNVRRLNIGQTSLDKGSMMKQFLSNGLFSEFLNDKGRYLSILQGRTQQFGSLMDMPFTGSMQPSQGSATSVRLGKGAVEGPHSHVFFGHYRMGQDINELRTRLSQLVQRSTVIGFSKSLNIGARGRIEADLSKSMMEMSFVRSPLDSFGGTPSFLKTMTAGDMFSSMSFNVDYSNHIESWQLEHRVYVRHAGNRYVNPGNPFLPAGTTELGLHARKTAFKGKLTGTVRASGRYYAFQTGEGTRYRNLNLMADLRWRFRRGQFVSARYQPSSFRSMGADGKLLNSMSRLAVEGQLVQRIAGLQYRNYTSIAHTKNDYGTGQSQQPMRTYGFMINMNQQIMLKSNTPFMNLLVNRVNNQTGFVFFNNSMQVDAGTSFSIGKMVSASSAVVYNEVNNWYKQLGIRQSISANLRTIQCYFNLDMRKNLSVSNPLYMQNFRMDWGLRYTLNSQTR